MDDLRATPAGERARDALPLIAWLVSLAVAILAFTAMGGGRLAAPPVTDPGAWGDWAADRDAVVATVAVLRLVVLALAWYLVGVTTIGAVGRVARWARLVRVADALSVPVVRRVLQTSLGVGLATTVVVASAGGAMPVPRGPTMATPAAQTAPDAPERATDTPRMHPVDVSDGPAMTPLERTRGPDLPPDAPSPDLPPPGMRPLPPTTPSAIAEPVVADVVEDPAPAPDASPPAAGATVTVEVGDHLWAIAERHLSQLGGRADDAEVAAYWDRLVDANRDRLVDPANPDLILPGQQFVLPDVDPSGTAG